MAKKKTVAIVVLGVVVLSAVALAAVVPATQASGERIALLRLTGPIQESGNPGVFGGGAITPESVLDQLEEIKEDSSIKAVILRVDSPGGSVAASQEISDAVKNHPAEVPIVVSMGDMAASGGYYISAFADSIVAQPGTLTGSIGVIWSDIDPTGLFKKLGIKVDAITAGKHKDMFLPGHLTKERRKIVQTLVDQMYDQFVTTVAEGRELPDDDVRKLATGQVYTGEQAIENGLVDELGGLDTAEKTAEELAGIADGEVVEYSPSVFDLFAGSGASALISRFAPEVDPKLLLLREILTGANVPRYIVP